MCFSTTASFTAGAVLSVIGGVTLRKAASPSEKLFASIPLIFAVQQITEGFVWLSLSRPEFAPVQQGATYLFIFFAQVVWPVWVPYSIFRLEKNVIRKRIFGWLVVTGILISAYLGYCLLKYPVIARITGYHIAYQQDYPPAFGPLCAVFYLISTIAPPFFSSVKRMWLLGTTILVSYIMTMIFYVDYIVSVWCFFASIISIAVFVILSEERKRYG
jgi:hypothetical protein